MASDDCFKVTAMDVEGHSFESVHGGKLDLNGFGSGYGNGSGSRETKHLLQRMRGDDDESAWL